MGLDRRPTHGDLLLERGSAALEGIAAIAVVFVLFTVLAQAATALIAHRAAQGAVAAAASRVAVDPWSERAAESRLSADLGASVPGAAAIESRIDVGRRFVTATARFELHPPGPLFRAIVMEVSADAPLVVAP